MLCFSNLKLLFKTFVLLFMHSLDMFHKLVYLKGLCPEIHCDSKGHLQTEANTLLVGKSRILPISTA